MSDKPTFPTADLMDERHSLGRGFQLLVAHALKRGDPLYYVRSPSGTTLDLCASLTEAKKSHAKEPGSKIMALKGTALTEVTV